MRMNTDQGIDSAFAFGPRRWKRPGRMIMGSAQIFQDDDFAIAFRLLKSSETRHERWTGQKRRYSAVKLSLTPGVDRHLFAVER